MSLLMLLCTVTPRLYMSVPNIKGHAANAATCTVASQLVHDCVYIHLFALSSGGISGEAAGRTGGIGMSQRYNNNNNNEQICIAP